MNALIGSFAQYIVPLVVLIAGYVYHLVNVHIPAETRAYLAPFADRAVLFVEQQFAGSTSTQKKQMAMDAIHGFFKVAKLPAPPDDVLSKWIEASVNTLNNPPTPVVGKP